MAFESSPPERPSVTVVLARPWPDRAALWRTRAVLGVAIVVGLALSGAGLFADRGYDAVLVGGLLTVVGVAWWAYLPTHLRRRRERMSGRLEVSPTRIVWRQASGTGREWRNSPGAVVRVVGRGSGRRLVIAGETQGLIPQRLRLFDLERVRAACVEAGWSWQEGNGPVLDAVPFGPADVPETDPDSTLLLRDGVEDPVTVPRAFAVSVVVVVMSLAFIAAEWLGSYRPWWAAILVAPLLLVALGIYALVRSRRLKVELTVTPDRLAVRYGPSGTTVERASVATAVLSERFLTCRGIGGRVVMLIGTHGRRDDIAALLTQNGWPVAAK